MQYGLAFRYALDRTGGSGSVLLMTLCEMIPIIGTVATLGYRAEVAIALLDDSDELRRHPRFDFNKFGEYLQLGVWPFLMQLLLAICMVIPMLASMFGGMAIGAAINDPMLGMFIAFAGYMVSYLLFIALAVTMTFHSELVGRFDFGGGLRFTFQFLATVGGTAIVAAIIYSFLSFFVIIVGLLCCFVGIYPAIVVIQMAAQHLMVQLHIEYQERGGEPIPIEAPMPRRRRRRYEEDYDDDEDEDERDRDERYERKKRDRYDEDDRDRWDDDREDKRRRDDRDRY